MQSRRNVLTGLMAGASLAALGACRSVPSSGAVPVDRVMTVNGWLDASAMGLTLAHEHLFADVRPYADQQTDPFVPDIAEVTEVVLPYLQTIKALGCKTLVDATATELGRSPLVARQLSLESGLNVLVPAGIYLAADERFKPAYVETEEPETIAARWISEWHDGIGNTGVRPGFLKLGVNGGDTSQNEAKAIAAAARTHLETGLTIAVHTSPWAPSEPGHNARSARRQLEILAASGVDPSAWIWVHAQNEPRTEVLLELAGDGAWISLDGYRPGQEAAYLSTVLAFAEADLLGQMLLSQDAGWYTAGEPRGGDFSPFDPILTTLIPALKAGGLSDADINTLFVSNPARAFAVKLRAA